MRLRRIEVRDFRKIKGPMVLQELGDGLTIVAGDNEEGKSSLLAALKAAFFDQHTLSGAARQAMTSWATDTVPAIDVDFELDGRRWELRKAFRRGGCTLAGPATRLEGDAAERRLQELLRFERPGRGPSGPAHQGLAALFWIEQGTTIYLQPGVEIKDRLGAIIAGEVGGVAEGRHGRQVVENVEKESARFWTAGKKERAPLIEAREKIARARRDELTLQQRIDLVRDKVDRLASLRGQQRQRAARDDIGRAQERLRELRARMAGIERLEVECAQAIERLKAAEAEVSRLTAMQRGRAMLQAEMERLEAERLALQAERDATARERELVEVVLSRAAVAERSAAAKLARAAADLQQSMRRRACTEASRRLERLRAASARALELDQSLRQRKNELTGYRVTPAAHAAICAAADARSAASAALEAVATRIEFRPELGQIVELDGRSIDAGLPVRLVERAELRLGGFGRIVVSPGGEDLATRQARLAAARRQLAELLVTYGLTEPGEAEALLAARRACEAEVDATSKVLQATLAAEAATSVSALEDQLAALERDMGKQFPDQRDVEASAGDGEAILRLERLVVEQRREAEQCHEALAMAEQRVSVVGRRAAELDGRVAAQALSITRHAERLERDRAEHTDDVVEKALATALDLRHSAAGTLEEVRRRLRPADAERVRGELELAAKTAAATEAEAFEFERRLREAEVEARTLGSEELGERLAAAEAERDLAERALRRLLLEARAWRMLKEEIQVQEQQLRRAWTAPVRARLAPLLDRVLPGVEPIVDPASLTLSHLHRSAFEEPLNSLSLGTREQISILVRIALAQLVASREGEAPCLVLDDALVYADEARLEAMKAVIERAAGELQILLLTCRPRDYLGLDAQRLRLRDCLRGDRPEAKLVLPPS